MPVQLLDEAALLRQRDEIEGVFQLSLLRYPACHHLKPGQTAVFEPDHRLEVGHYPAFPQGAGQLLLR
ncbi:hypothetical protein D3C79_800050 [compost metagenome]